LLCIAFVPPQVAAVADIGGATVEEATRRMMTFLLQHELSRQYNFVGRNGRREFKALKLFEAIYGRCTCKVSQYTNILNMLIFNPWGSLNFVLQLCPSAIKKIALLNCYKYIMH